MKIAIDESIVEKRGMDIPLFLTALLIKTGIDYNKEQKKLIKRGSIVKIGKDYFTVQSLNDRMDSILLDSDKSVPSQDELKPFAKELMAIMPQHKKPNTPYYYKCNATEVSLSLQRFYKIYDMKCSKEDIKRVLKDYVDSFNGDYTYMQLLKNFIYKVDNNGDFSSGLASYLENEVDE